MKQNNLFFLCGPHGSGKTTLGEKLAEANPRILIPELYSRNVKFNISDERYRQTLKIASRAIESYEYLKIAKENPDKILIGNRCIYDVLAYNWVHFMKGWISLSEYDRFNEYLTDFFREEVSSPLAIVLNPSFDKIIKHLNERWKKSEKKWREDDLEYARLAHQAYNRFRDNEDILYIDHEIELRDNSEILDINLWLEEKIRNKEQQLDYIKR